MNEIDLRSWFYLSHNLYFSNKSETLPVESQLNITTLALAPDGNLLIAVNEGMKNMKTC